MFLAVNLETRGRIAYYLERRRYVVEGHGLCDSRQKTKTATFKHIRYRKDRGEGMQSTHHSNELAPSLRLREDLQILQEHRSTAIEHMDRNNDLRRGKKVNVTLKVNVYQ